MKTVQKKRINSLQTGRHKSRLKVTNLCSSFYLNVFHINSSICADWLMVIQRNMTSTKPPMVQTRCIHAENLTLALEQESVSGWVCGVTSCGLFAFLSLSQRLITHKIIKHTCANTHVPLIRSGLLCRHYSPQVLTRAETISTNALQSREPSNTCASRGRAAWVKRRQTWD